MFQFKIKHATIYQYDSDVFDIRNLVKAYPIEDSKQNVKSHFLSITNNPSISIHKDGFGNKYGSFYLSGPLRELNITSTFDIHTFEVDELAKARSKSHSWNDMKFFSMDKSYQIFLYQQDNAYIPELTTILNNQKIYQKDLLDVVLDLNQYIFNNFRYCPGITSIDTPLITIWNMKAGVCQDFAHVLIKILRVINIPARYVSGYICPNNNGMVGAGASHAWVEAYLPNYGWLGVDPTNNCLALSKHIRVAYGRDYNDVSPIVGEFRGNSNQRMLVDVTVSYY